VKVILEMQQPECSSVLLLAEAIDPIKHILRR